MAKHRKGLVLIALTSLLMASCTTRTGHGLRQTKPVRHGFQSCTTGIEHLPFGWDVSSRPYRSNVDNTIAAWVYVTVCKSGWGLGAETATGYQVVLYNPQHPNLFSLEGDELRDYLDDNTVLAVDTNDISAFSPMVTRDVNRERGAAPDRDLKIILECSKTCDATRVKIYRREWNGANLHIVLADVSSQREM